MSYPTTDRLSGGLPAELTRANRSTSAPQTRHTVEGLGRQTAAEYKRAAVAAVTRVTRQRVVSFVSSHDRDTDVATEVFTLEASLSRGAPRAESWLGQAPGLVPPRASVERLRRLERESQRAQRRLERATDGTLDAEA
jgi:hypothetical protein